MQIRSFRGSGEPVWVNAPLLKCVVLFLGPDPRRALGPAATPAASTGRTRDRTRPMLQKRKKVLASAPSTRDPTVWTGRALQAESAKWQCWSCSSVSGPCVEQIISWPSWISARVRSHSRIGPLKASWVTRSRTRRRDRSPSPQIQLADLGRCLLIKRLKD